MKSRFMSKPLPFARVPATRPSGFWMTLKTTMTWLRMSSTSGFTPYGVLASSLMSCMLDSTPSYSFPWMAPFTKTGTLTSSPHDSRRSCACAGFVEREATELDPALEVADLLRRLLRVEHDGVKRPAEAEWPMTSTLMRSPSCDASMLASVQPIAS